MALKVKFITSFGSILVVLLGLSVVIGWHIDSKTLVQINENFVPMQYNTALGFILSGLGILFFLRDKRKAFFLLGLLLTLLGALTLIQYIFKVNLHIDQLFMKHYVQVQTSHPGRMAPNTALCFMLIGLAFTLLVTLKKYKFLLTSLLVSIIVCFGLIAFIGYLANVETAYGWGNLTRMAIHTSVGVLLVGASLLISFCNLSFESPFPNWLPYSVFFFFLTVTVCVSQIIYMEKEQYRREFLDAMALQMKSAIRTHMDNRIKSFERMRDRWVHNKGMKEELWKNDAINYAKGQPEVKAYEWVDNNNVIRWIVPLEGNDRALNLNLAFEKDRETVLLEAKKSQSFKISNVIELVQEGDGILIVCSINIEGKQDGYLVVVLILKDLFDHIFKRIQIHDVSYSIDIGEKEVCQFGGQEYRALSKIVSLDIPSITNWSLSLWPSQSFYATHSNFIVYLTFAVGLIFSILICVLLVSFRKMKSSEKLAGNNLIIAKENEKRMQLILESVNDGYWDWDLGPDGKGTNDEYLSPKFKALFGYEDHELLNSVETWRKLIHPDDFNLAYANFEKHIQSNTEFPYNQDVRYTHKDGRIIWVNCRGVALKDVDTGKYTRMIGAHTDITDLKHAEERFKFVIQATPIGMLLVDSNGKILIANKKVEEYFQYPIEEIIDHDVEILLPDVLKEKHRELRNNYMKSPITRNMGSGLDLFGRRKDGSKIAIEVALNPLSIDKGSYIICSILDVSERKETEEEKAMYLQQLETSNAELDEFAFIASHDLKEPLRGIQQQVQIIEEDYSENLDDDAKARLKKLAGHCMRMQNFLGDLLHYSRVGRSDTAMQDRDLNQVVKEAIADLESYIEMKNAKVEIIDPLPNRICDGIRMKEVFKNLISNGIKYNSSEQIKIEIGVKQIGEMQTVYVKDNGIGIDEKHHKKIFKIFKRLHAKDEYEGGTGSGMAIVKRIIDLHNGDIWVNSIEGEGAIFYIHLKD